MINKVWAYIQKYHMIAENDYIVAGVSGGADSICLLLMLLELRKRCPFSIHVVHMNHKIREEAGQDAAYVADVCKQYQVPFTLRECDVEELAKREHISTEEAGRKVRYDAFYEVLAQNAPEKKGKIAIAHNQSDCAETFMWNLFRGSSVRGLTGISPVRDEIIRPIMCLTRVEIEAYLAQKEVGFCIDRTNLENTYTRNKIRNQVFPLVEKEISNQAISHIFTTCEKMQEINQLLQDMIEDAARLCILEDTQGVHIIENKWQSVHPTIRSYVVMEALARAAKSRKDLENIHVEQIMELFDRQNGKEIHLPYGLTAIREYAGIGILYKQEQKDALFYALTAEDVHTIEAGQEIEIRLDDKACVCCRLILAKEALNGRNCAEIEKIIPANPYTKWVDYDTIKDNIVIRNRQTGDYMTVNSMCQHKSLKSIMIDNKIPKLQRDQIVLIAEGQHILWMIGGRISSFYKVTDRTSRILEVTYKGGSQDG